MKQIQWRFLYLTVVSFETLLYVLIDQGAQTVAREGIFIGKET